MATPIAAMDLANGVWPEGSSWLAIAGLAIGPTALASVAYFALLRRAGPTFVTQTNYVLPLWAVAMGAVLFGEALTPQALVALALIAAGLFIAQDGPALVRRWLASRGSSAA